MADETIKLAFEGVLDNAEIAKLTNQIGKGFAEGTKEGATEGAKRAQKVWTDLVKAGTAAGLEGGIVRSAKKIDQIGSRINLANMYARQLQIAYELNDSKEIARLERRLKLETEGYEELAGRRQQHMEEFTRLQKRQFAEVADDFGSSLQSSLSALGSGDFGDLIKGLGKRAQRRGDVAATRGATPDATKTQKMIGGMGKMMEGVGKALMGIGAVVGVVVMLVKMFIDLDSKVKEMNKSLMASAGAADFGLRGGVLSAGRQIETSIETMRDDIIAAASDMRGFRQSSEDMYAVVTAMNEANYTFEQMQHEIDHTGSSMADFADVTQTAIAYSKLLGVDMTTAASDMARVANEMGQNLQTVAEGFASIHREAMLSGFSAKRFYSTVLEVTSGMGAYNVRVEEAAAMLRTLGNVLGETVGADFLKSISTGFKDASQQEKMTEVIKRGGPGSKAMRDLFTDVANSQAEGMFRDLGRAEGGLAAMQKAGIDTSSAEAFAASMAKASPKQQKQAREEMARAGIDPKLAQRFDNLTEQFAAARGNFAAMTEAMSNMGPAATLAMLRKPGGPFGGQSISEAMDKAIARGDPTVRAALEELTGKQGADLDALIDADRKFSDNFDAAQADAKRIAKGDLKNSREVQMAMAERYGVAVDSQTGELKKASLDANTGEIVFGKAVEDVEDYILAQNDLQEEMNEAVTEDIELGRRIAHATEGFENVLKENINQILVRIYERISDIYNELLEFFGSTGPENERARKGALNRLSQSEQSAERQAQAMREKIDELITQSESASEEEKESLRKQIEVYEEGVMQLEQQAQNSRAMRAELGKAEYEGAYGDAGQYLEAAADALGQEGYGGASTYDVNKEFYERFGEGGMFHDYFQDWVSSGELEIGGKEYGAQTSGEMVDQMAMLSGARNELYEGANRTMGAAEASAYADDAIAKIKKDTVAAMARAGADPEARRAAALEAMKSGIGQALHRAGSFKTTGGVDKVVAGIEKEAAKIAAERAKAKADREAATAKQEADMEKGRAALEDRPVVVNVTVENNEDGSVNAEAEVDAAATGTEP